MMRHLLEAHGDKICLVVGNGVNLYAGAQQQSWGDLLEHLQNSRLILKQQEEARKLAPHHVQGSAPDQRLSMTEFYDLLAIGQCVSKGAAAKSVDIALRREVKNSLEGWRAQPQHRRITDWCHSTGAGLITTNFDGAFSDDMDLFEAASARNLRRYPWEKYFASEPLCGGDPLAGFGIWHVNGMVREQASICLGLGHYSALVRKAHDRLYVKLRGRNEPEDCGLFHRNATMQAWRGASTWLQLLFHRRLLIFGLDLGPSETFLRWLLIERAKYLTNPKGGDLRFGDGEPTGWYIHLGADQDPAKYAFLQGVGIEPTPVASYDDIYGEAVWSA